MSRQGEDILDLVERGSFKQALQLVGKMVNQFPTMTYAKVLEQYVRYRQNKKKYDFEKGLKPLLETKSPPNDAKSLELLHDFLLELGMFESALGIYATAMQKYPTFEIGYNWFVKSIEDMNFKQMSQSTLKLPRLSSEPRMVEFWNAVSTVALLKLQKEPLSEQEYQIRAEMSYKTLISLKPFTSDQERIVFCQVCELCPNKSQDIVDELLPALLQESSQNSVDLYLKNFLITHLRILEDDENMFKCCGKFLEYFDDFEVLKELLRSGKAVSKKEAELKAYLDKRDSRNHRLAHLEMDVVFSGNVTDTSLTYYLDRFHNKPCCATDLDYYKTVLPTDQALRIFDTLPEGLIHDCNRCKIADVADTKIYIHLYDKYQITLDDKPKTDYSACSYFLLKVVESLVQDQSLDVNNLVTAVSLLEAYQIKDPHNYDTRVWLVLLYSYMGATSVAYEHYSELKIKNLQHDVLDHLLASRISSIFPNKQHAYVTQLLEGDRVYQSAENLPQFIRIAFERKSYSKILGMLELCDRLNRSSMRWLKAAERLQLSRAVNDKRGDQLKKLHESWRQLKMYGSHHQARTNANSSDSLVLSDNRDFHVTGPSGASGPDPGLSLSLTCTKLSQYAAVGESQILMLCVREMIVEMVTTGERDPDIDSYLASGRTPAGKGDHDHVTPSDAWAYRTLRHLYEHGCEDGEGIVGHVRAAPPIRPALWELVHDYVCRLTTLKTLDNTRRIKDKTARHVIKTELRATRDSCHGLFQDYLATLQTCTPNKQLLEAFGCKDCTAKIVAGVRDTFRTACNL